MVDLRQTFTYLLYLMLSDDNTALGLLNRPQMKVSYFQLLFDKKSQKSHAWWLKLNIKMFVQCRWF